MGEVYYFGCWGRSGHFLFDREGRQPTRGAIGPWKWGELDAAYVPNKRQPGVYRDWERENAAQVQSLCKVTHVQGWTVLAMWDRSVDHRGGSNSSFVTEGTHDYAAMVALAREHFPTIVQRIEAAAPMHPIGETSGERR